jgi:hypothetical protein
MKKKKKYHTVGIVPKSRIIIGEKGNIATPNRGGSGISS